MLDIRDLSLTYKKCIPHVDALRDLSLKVGAKESIGIIGESGCGKTSLALSVMGLMEKNDISGHIAFDGDLILNMPEKRKREIRWNKISIVFQNALEIFNPVITIGEQIAEPMRTHLKLRGKDIDKRVSELFEITGLEPQCRHLYPHQLSGGMRQRALIAMAICCGPKLIIFDEPFSALDAENRHAMVHLIQALKEKMDFSMILISHNIPAIQQLTSRMVTLYSGMVVEEGRTAEVLRNPIHPYTRALINAVPEFFQYKDLWGIGGEPPVSGKLKGCPFAPRCVQKGELCGKEIPALRMTGIERKIACHKNGIEVLLKARGLTKKFMLEQNKIIALKNVDIQLRKGEVLAIAGASGSGKSTLAHILVNILQGDGGEVFFKEKKVCGRNATAVTGGLQIVFQDPAEAISPRLTVMEAVREPLDIMRWKDKSSRDKKAVKTLTSVHLPVAEDFLKRNCNALSGGQRQRLAIARALVTDPSVMIADEITAMLDPSTQATILRELKSLQNKRGFSMIFITHDIYLARKVADRVCILENGRVKEEGSSFELFNHSVNGHSHPLLQAAFAHDKTIVN